jgi:hypothetical protein
LRQAPLPSHLPSVAHIAAVMSLHMPCGSAPPAAVLVQVPSEPAIPQLLHGPVQVVAQQKLSAQWPFTQSASAVQDCPSTFLPQVPVFCPLGIVQACPGAQSAAVVHDSVQAPLAQAKLPQEKAFGGWQVPSPSHVRAELPEVGPRQAAAPHGVLAG